MHFEPLSDALIAKLARTSDTIIPPSQVSPQPLTWLWPQHIPRGKLTLLDGEPGSGTSLLALTFAACLSSGHPLPGTPTTTSPANVVLIAPHDDAADTITPRFQAAGGDPDHLFLLSHVPSPDANPGAPMTSRPFSLADDLALLEATIERLSAVLVILDPLHSLLDSHRTRSCSLRAFLFSLAQLAQRTGCAFLLIRHVTLRPSSLRSPRPPGSPESVSAARSGLLLLSDPGDEATHLLVPSKHPLCQKPAILAYQVLADDEAGVPAIHWLPDWQPSSSNQPLPVPTLSAQRQAIRDSLLKNPTAANPREIAAHTGSGYESVRKMLQRLRQEGELVSPARGLYTLHFETDPETLPADTHVPNVTIEPDGANSQNPLPPIVHSEGELTHVATVPGEPSLLTTAPLAEDLPDLPSIPLAATTSNPLFPSTTLPPFPPAVFPQDPRLADPYEDRYPSAVIRPRNDDSP